MLPDSPRDRSSSEQSYQRARQYWREGKGLSLWQSQHSVIAPLIDPIAKSHGLELTAAAPLLPLSRIRHQVQWAPALSEATSSSTLICEPSTLALPDNLMDLVIVHHLLDILADPHYLLGEAARVTDDNGRLIIIGWHPYGVAGLNRIGPARYKHFPYNLEWHPTRRLKDWLRFVDFEIERVDYCGFPLGKRGLEGVGRRYNLPLGSSYILTARRKQLRVIPLKPKWGQRFWFHSGAVASGYCRHDGVPRVGQRFLSSTEQAQHSKK